MIQADLRDFVQPPGAQILNGDNDLVNGVFLQERFQLIGVIDLDTLNFSTLLFLVVVDKGYDFVLVAAVPVHSPFGNDTAFTGTEYDDVESLGSLGRRV